MQKSGFGDEKIPFSYIIDFKTQKCIDKTPFQLHKRLKLAMINPIFVKFSTIFQKKIWIAKKTWGLYFQNFSNFVAWFRAIWKLQKCLLYMGKLYNF